jgi:hypothetical protein
MSRVAIAISSPGSLSNGRPRDRVVGAANPAMPDERTRRLLLDSCKLE